MGRRASFCCEVSNVQGHRHARMSGRTQYGDPSWRSIVPNGLGTVNFLGHPTLVFLIQPACQRPASQQDNLITSRRKSPFFEEEKETRPRLQAQGNHRPIFRSFPSSVHHRARHLPPPTLRNDRSGPWAYWEERTSKLSVTLLPILGPIIPTITHSILLQSIIGKCTRLSRTCDSSSSSLPPRWASTPMMVRSNQLCSKK